MGPKFQFLKKVFTTNFFTHKTCFTTFHVDRSQKIDKHFFEPIFQNFFKLLSPYGTKISIFEKSVSDDFFIHKPCFTTFHVDRSQKMDKNFFEPIFSHFPKNFTNVCPPMGPKTQFLKKIVSDNFFIHKPCFTTFHVDRSQKMDKHFFGPIFQNFLQVIVS